MFGLSPIQLVEMNEKIISFIPKIKEQIPKLKQVEKIESEKMGLQSDEMLLYSALFSETKIFLYVFKCLIAKEPFIVNGKKIPKNSIVVIDQIKKIEITEYLDRAEKEGLISIISEFTNIYQKTQ